MTTVYIIRHAEAEGNLYRRIHGWYDSRLTEQGFLQVEALRKRFEKIHIDAVYSSDKQRTRDTARSILDGRDIVLQETELLREFGVGEWEDKTWGEVQEFDRERYLNFNRDPEKFIINGAERHSDIQKRMLKAVKLAAAENEGKTVAMFTHGAAIRALLALILDVPSERIQEVVHGDNTAVTKLLVDGDDINIEYFCDSSHLNGMTRTKRQQWLKNGGTDNCAMRFVPVSFDTDSADYLKCREEFGFDAERLGTARKRSESDADSVVWALKENTRAGLIELAPDKSTSGAGVIDFYCMLPEYREKTLAVQLLGHAVSYYRKRGFTKLGITVPARCGETLGFFEHFGFKKIWVNSEGTVMEKAI